MKIYFDGSETSGDGDQWMTLAAIIASDAIWASFQKAWEEMLRDRYPIAPFIHMTDLVTGNDPFERTAGWTDYRKRKLVYDAGEVLRRFEITRLCAAYCTINLTAREKLIAEGLEFGDPVAICAENCLGHTMDWHIERHGLEIAYLYFDRNEPYKATIYNRWKFHDDKLIKHLVWGRIGGISEVDMKFTPPIQAADIAAWAISRAHRSKPGDVWSTLASDLLWTRDPITRKPRPGMLTTRGLVMDEAWLRKHQKKFRPRDLG